MFTIWFSHLLLLRYTLVLLHLVKANFVRFRDVSRNFEGGEPSLALLSNNKQIGVEDCKLKDEVVLETEQWRWKHVSQLFDVVSVPNCW